MLTPDEVRRRVDRLRDHASFCRESLTIRNEQGGTVPLELAPGQLKFRKLVEKCSALGKPLRAAILKCRQGRLSSGVASELFRRVAFWPGQQALVSANDYGAAANIWGYYDQFDKSYRRFEDVAKLQRIRSSRPTKTTPGYIKWAQDSLIQTGSANSVHSGRSYSWRHLHLSEYAFYGDAGAYMTGLMPSMPDDLNTSIVVESTANGVGDPFYDLIMATLEGRNQYEFMFFGWWEEPKYTLAVPDPARFKQTLTDDELDLQQKYKLSYEQIAWRRFAISDKCQGSLDRFKQEYPSCAEEAFLTSGRPYFDQGGISRMPRQDPVEIGDLLEVQVGPQKRLTVAHNDKGSLRIWRRPIVGHYYCIGGDVANGRDASDRRGSTSDPDYSVAFALDVDTGEQVAVFEKQSCIPDDFGAYMASLGYWYNRAFLVPERNSFGAAVVLWLMRNKYPLEAIYATGRVPGDRRPPEYHQLGYLTNNVTRPALLGQFQGAVVTGTVLVHDPRTLQQLRTFVWLNGKPQGQTGCHDDLVIGGALAYEGLKFAPRAETENRKSGKRAGAGTAFGGSQKKGPEYD